MGVVNVTPDSFSDGGRFFDPAAAVAHARRLAEEGADILDIGGESTRPGAASVSEDQELFRVMPVLEKIADLCVSVDTRRPRVMREALKAGASMINDVDALTAPDAMEAVGKSNCAVCLMHKKGEPATMQRDPHYDDVVAEVKAFLDQRIDAARAAGIARERIVVDPGFGFGKTAAHNMGLLKGLPALLELNQPILVGSSRKSTLGKITGRPVDERLAGSLAMALLALQAGATILRVHDVKETRDVVAIWEAFRGKL
jgi:dihydropteroate synthase